MKTSQWWIQLAMLGLFIVIWHLFAISGKMDAQYLPSPSAVGHSFWKMIIDGRLPEALQVSIGRLLSGYFLSCIVGLAGGILIYQSKAIASTFGSLVPGLLSLPSICWLPLAVIWFPNSPESAIQFVVVMGAFFCIAYATENGMRTVNPVLVRAAKTMGAKGFYLSWTVLLPAALPAIIAGLKQGWAFAWRALMAGELLLTAGGKNGFGILLQQGREQKDVAMLFALIFVIMAIGFSVDFLFFAPIEKRVRKRFGLEQ